LVLVPIPCFEIEGETTSRTEEEGEMRSTILTLLMMIAVGVFASAQGRDTQSVNVRVVDAVETGQPRVVLAKSGMRQQKEMLQQNEGCQVIPNGELSQQKPNEQDGSTMKGLVF